MEVANHANWEYRCQKAEALVAAYLSQVESYRRELSAANAELASRPSEVIELEREVASLKAQLVVLQKRYDSQQEVVLLGEQYIAGLKAKVASHGAELSAQAQKLQALEGHATQVVSEYERELAAVRLQLAATQQELKLFAKPEPSEVTTASSADRKGYSSEHETIDEEEEEPKVRSNSYALGESTAEYAPASMVDPKLVCGSLSGGSQEAMSSDNHPQQDVADNPRPALGRSRSGGKLLNRSKSSKSSKSSSGSLVSTSTGFFSSIRHAMSAVPPASSGQQSQASSGVLSPGPSNDRGFARSSSLVWRHSSIPASAPGLLRGSARSPSVTVAYTPGVGCFVSLSGHSAWVRALCLAPDGTLWSGSSDRSIRAWKDGACVSTMPGVSKYQYRHKATDGHRESVYALVVAPDGILWSSSADKTIKGWQGTKCIATMSGHQGTVAALAVARDGTLYSGSYDKTIKIWKGAACAGTMRAHKDFVTCLAIGADGDLWSGSSDMTIKRWRGGECVETLAGHREEVFALAFGPDGTLWSGGGDHSVKGWRGKECVITLVGHRDWVLSVAVGPGGVIWSGSKDHTIRGWVDGKCIVIHEGHGNWVECLAAAPDGTLWSGSWDKTIKGWR